MINAVKEWIVQSIAAMLLVSVIQQLIPEGTIRKITAFLGGLILLIVMLQPIPKIKELDLESKFETLQQEFEKEKEDFEEINRERLAVEIERQVSEKIEQKAEAYGKTITVYVETEENAEKIPVPSCVEIEGEYQQELAAWIEAEWKIPSHQQKWKSTEKRIPA